MLWHVLDPFQRLLKMAYDLYKSPKDDSNRKELQNSDLPKSFMLMQHAYIYKAAGKGELLCEEPLDACTEVKVHVLIPFLTVSSGLVNSAFPTKG